MSNDFQIVGHEKIVKQLEKTIVKDKVSHAYLFVGEKGIGKKTVARYFAAAIQCTGDFDEEGRRITGRPCGQCRSCRLAFSYNHPDIRQLEYEKRQAGVDELREQYVNDASVLPYMGNRKVYIIKDVHLMQAAAMNACLKTVEEPPEYVVTILIADNLQTILPTIISRCVNINFYPLDIETVSRYLMEKKEVPDYAAKLAAAFSQGSPEKAVKIAMSEEFTTKKDELVKILRRIDDVKPYDLMVYAKNYGSDKEFFDDFLWISRCWFKDVLMLKATSDLNRVLFKEEYKYLKKQANVKSFEELEKINAGIDKAAERFKANVSQETILELLLLTMKNPV